VTGRPVALVLRALYLGDLLAGLPALAMVRAALPEHRIVLAAPAGVGRLALLAGSVDELTPGIELAPLTEAPRGASVAIDLHGNGPASRELLAATRPDRLIAFAGAEFIWRADEHEVIRWCRLVSEAFDVPPPWPGVAGSLPRPDVAVPGGLTIVHPGAKAGARRWPPERFVAVVEGLRSRGHDVLITGGRGEEELVRTISAAAGVPSRLDLPLDELLALVASSRLVVCGDTGVAHIASAYRTPSVVLFGPVSPARWGPPDDPRHRPLWHGDPAHPGDPHGDVPDPALLAIGVDEVLTAADQALAAGS
jgi:ADP-heptose:LPS heptosyltransferase